MCQNLSLVLLGDGRAPRLSEVHCDRDSVCVKTDTGDLEYRSSSIELRSYDVKYYVIEGLVFTRNN